MQCQHCQAEIPAGEDHFDYYGKTLCEDCYVSAVQPPRPCDPTAVSSALATRQMLRQTGTQGLTALQQDIYNYIKEKGSVTKQQLYEYFNLAPAELEKQFAVLRHCNLVRGYKEGNNIFLTLMNKGE
ncbi:hypothetical protein [Desulfurispora thermophila]|uniref:hypothetical protein n=1 Tax=Desulfurispora thermophila TaxID=265470 RepID=UPI000375EA12|nr:hypothetical protein [Desulfurispora thermophila]